MHSIDFTIWGAGTTP